MPSIPLNPSDVPFLLSGGDALDLDQGALDVNKPFPPTGAPILNLSFKPGTQQKMTLGQNGTVKIGVSTAEHAKLVPIFSDSTGDSADLLAANGLADFFAGGANPGMLVLALDVGAGADVSTKASFVYAPLTTSVTLNAGGDAGYAYLKAIPKNKPMLKAIPEFFKGMKLPEQITEPPAAGEAIALRYGGYLRLGAEVAAGYELAGTKAFSVGQLALSERYGLSMLGKVGVSAGVAGRFSILVTAGDRSGWTRVQVRRHSAADLKVAADVTVAVAADLQGLPQDPLEFLGAVLGVNGKSFMTVLQRVSDLKKFDTISAAVDGLAKDYISALIGKGFDVLAEKTELASLLDRVNTILASYVAVNDRSVTLFDRYFDRLPLLTSFLDRIAALDAKGLEQLRGSLNTDTFAILAQLTDGDPLGFLVGKIIVKGKQVDSLPELKTRAGAALDLVRKKAHQELRNAIGIAKSGFRIDGLLREASKILSVDGLKAIATNRLGLFISRLVGRTLDSSANIKAAFDELKQVLAKMDAFTDSLFSAIQEATSQAYQVALHAEYSRATERDALVDVLINLADPQGLAILTEAARGDFHRALTTPNANLVRVLEGVLTHRTRRESAYKVNIIGWHLNYAYEGFDRVITESEQRFVPSDRGILILSTTKLEVARERKRRDETMHVSFLLRALGESAGAIKAGSADNLQYLIESLTSLTASYQLAFTDDDTSQTELEDYLAFAKDLGFDAAGATLEALQPFLPRAGNDGFGHVETSYDVRFDGQAIKTLLGVTKLSAAGEAGIRTTMRNMVVANYLKGPSMHDVAFAYATPAVFDIFDNLGAAAFTNVLSPREFPVAPTFGVNAPARVLLDRAELNLLATLYSIENDMLDAVSGIIKTLTTSSALTPEAFEKALAKFGGALVAFDKFDQTSGDGAVGTTTIFAMFDALIRMASGATPANIGLLRLTTRVNDQPTEKLFLTPAAAR